MKDLDVGMYIRTKYGISKIEKMEEDKIHKTIWCTVDKAQYHSFLVRKQEILKASHNIIDLIEVGDIIITKHSGLGKEFVEIINSKTSLEFLKSYFKEKSLDLVEVLTKEQFESMSYKVKE